MFGVSTGRPLRCHQGCFLEAKDSKVPLSGDLSLLFQQHSHIAFLPEPVLPRPVRSVLFGAARMLCAAWAWCPAGRCSDGGGIQCSPICYNQPQQREEGPVRGTAAGFTLGRGQHFTLLVSQAVIGIERFPGSLWPSCFVAPCGATTGLQLAPVLLPITPPCFLPNSNAFARIMQSFALQHCPLTQAKPFLGSSTSQMSKTGKIFPPPPRESHIVLLLV